MTTGKFEDIIDGNDHRYYFIVVVRNRCFQCVDSLRWDQLTFPMAIKWRWYFEYRAALMKVQNPLYRVEFHWGKEMAATKSLEQNRNNKIRACKAKITEMNNKLKAFLVDKSSKELFSYEDHPSVLKYQERLEKYKQKLILLEETPIEKIQESVVGTYHNGDILYTAKKI